tara:strand:+ start:360 stop:746 length:387 start_codon:yes stop_codon:yes gene_type:complete
MLLIFDPIENNKQDHNKNLVLFALFFVCMLNLFSMLSLSDINFNLSLSFLASSILLALFVYFNSGDIKRYFVVYVLVHFISFGYIVMSIIIFSLYLFLEKYSNKIEYYFNPTLEDDSVLSDSDEFVDE